MSILHYIIQGGWTPLHWASYGRHLPIAQLLVENGAAILWTENNGKTPLALARGNEVKQFLQEQGEEYAKSTQGFKKCVIPLASNSDDDDDDANENKNDVDHDNDYDDISELEQRSF
jgi:ankyrin repeat protein